MSFLLVVVLILGGVFWYQQNQKQAPHAAITIATTIFPLTDIAKNIAGNRATVVQLIPPGASPHSYSLSPQDLERLKDAKVLFAIGHGLDDWSGKPAAKSVNVPLYVVDTNVALQKFGGASEGQTADSIDPHYWLAVASAKQIAQNITNKLIEIDPSYAEDYTAHFAQYATQLDALDAELQTRAKSMPQKKFIAIHDAWSYFAHAYNLSLIASYEPVEGKEPSIADIASFQEIIKKNHITTFYTEPQKQSNSATRLMQQEFGLSIRVLDPLGGIEGRNSYIDLMRYNMDQLAQDT